MDGKRVGLLGGTFDPIHVGHLNLAFELMEKRGLDEVWFIPARVSPFKEKNPPQIMDHRLEMVQLAIKGIPQFHVKDLEKHRPSPSYTVDTLKALVAEHSYGANPHHFYLLLGEDAIERFPHWYLPEEIVKLVRLLIGTRRGLNEHELPPLMPLIGKSIEEGLTPIHLMDVSSTEIRARLAKKMYCGHLVPAAVLEYIEKNQLYANF